MDSVPYLSVVASPRQMAGKGAPKDTLFGVLGHTKDDSFTRSLGGLVQDTKASAPVPTTTQNRKVKDTTEHHIAGKPSKTEIPKQHMGMVPYAGYYMSAVGKRLS